MARPKTLEVKMNNGDVFFVNENEYNSMGISDSPDAFIGGYIRGSRGPMLRVNTLVDMTGAEHYINPSLISSLRITYL